MNGEQSELGASCSDPNSSLLPCGLALVSQRNEHDDGGVVYATPPRGSQQGVFSLSDIAPNSPLTDGIAALQDIKIAGEGIATSEQVVEREMKTVEAVSTASECAESPGDVLCIEDFPFGHATPESTRSIRPRGQIAIEDMQVRSIAPIGELAKTESVGNNRAALTVSPAMCSSGTTIFDPAEDGGCCSEDLGHDQIDSTRIAEVEHACVSGMSLVHRENFCGIETMQKPSVTESCPSEMSEVSESLVTLSAARCLSPPRSREFSPRNSTFFDNSLCGWADCREDCDEQELRTPSGTPPRRRPPWAAEWNAFPLPIDSPPPYHDAGENTCPSPCAGDSLSLPNEAQSTPLRRGLLFTPSPSCSAKKDFRATASLASPHSQALIRRRSRPSGGGAGPLPASLAISVGQAAFVHAIDDHFSGSTFPTDVSNNISVESPSRGLSITPDMEVSVRSAGCPKSSTVARKRRSRVATGGNGPIVVPERDAVAKMSAMKTISAPKSRKRSLQHQTPPPLKRSREANIFTTIDLQRSEEGSSGRPRRQRMRPLEHWRNETLVYERQRDSLTPSVVAVRVATSVLTSPGEERALAAYTPPPLSAPNKKPRARQRSASKALADIPDRAIGEQALCVMDSAEQIGRATNMDATTCVASVPHCTGVLLGQPCHQVAPWLANRERSVVPCAMDSRNSCEIIAGLESEFWLCYDVVVPPASRSGSERVDESRTLLLSVLVASSGTLQIRRDGSVAELGVGDNIVVRSGQEYEIVNTSGVADAVLKMVLIVTPQHESETCRSQDLLDCAVQSLTNTACM